MTAVKLLTALFFLLQTVQSIAQTNFDVRRQQLKPTLFDTAAEKTFIYEVANAVLYFKQEDILGVLSNPHKTKGYSISLFTKLTDTLKSGVQIIKVKDIFYSYGEAQRDSILKHETITSAVQELNKEFYFVGGDLILNGHFMVKSKETNAFVFKHLVAKRQTSLLGQKDLVFLLPTGKVFYDVLIAFGE